ncbi:pre-rRNA processing protein [Blastocladiella emersonii ATCC 22665]|nr:pre-rRNA processing protein [Blastocladiella emersonii ATCC 22665]
MTNSLQRKIADVQQSIDSVLVQAGVLDGNATAKFGALLTFLDQHKDLADAEEDRCAALYLLAEACNDVPRPLLKAERAPLLAIPAAIVSIDMEMATTVRYALRCMEKAFNALDAAAWREQHVKDAFDVVVALAIDDRATVRKAAHQSIRHFLVNPPPPQQVHPVAKHAGNAIGKLAQGLLAAQDYASAAHVLTLLQRIASFLPDAVVEPMVDLLFNIPPLNIPDLTRSVFLVYGAIAARDAAVTQWDAAKIGAFTDAILSSKPHYDDRVLGDAWLSACSHAVEALYRVNPALCAARFLALLTEHLFPSLQSTHPTILAAAARVISHLIATCIPAAMVDHAVTTARAAMLPASQREDRADLEAIIITCELGLSVRYKAAWPHVLRILTALVRRLGPHADVLMRNTIELLGDFCENAEFPHQPELAEFLSVAIEFMGPRKFLAVLPLNIREAGQPGVKPRPFLLPLIADAVQRTEVAYFTQEFVPLAEYLRSRADDYLANEREIEAKVHDALYVQVWSTLPGFCTFPTDLKSSFGDLGKVLEIALKDHDNLRPVACAALHNLISKNQELAAMSPDAVPAELVAVGLTPDVGALNVRGLASTAKMFLPILFNVYKTLSPNARGYVAALIGEFVQIAPVQPIQLLYSQIMRVLQNPESEAGAVDLELQAALLDLVALLIPRLPAEPINTLLQLVLQGLSSAHQKKCYKLLTRMLAMENGRAVLQANLPVLQERVLVGATLATEASAKKYRLQFLTATVDQLMTPSAGLVTALLPEAMESVKEVNHECRSLANELIVKLANKMLEDDGGDDVVMGEHGIERFITTVAAGLVAGSAHFVSATIDVLARLCFEFKDLVSDELFTKMLTAILLLVQSENREVAKSIFKFVKAALSAFPAETIFPHLPQIVHTALVLGDSYASEFKVGVRHLLQRLCREFSIEAIDALVPENHKRLVANIRKRTKRAQLRKEAGSAGAGEADSDDEATASAKPAAGRGASFASAFDAVVYGDSSDSELDEEAAAATAASRRSKQQAQHAGNLYIQEGDDAPMDFLDRRVVSHVLSSKPRALKQKQEERKRKLDAEFKVGADGRLVISTTGGNDSDTEETLAKNPAAAFDYYMESVQSTEGFTRAGRRIKFNHAETQAARNKAEWSDDEGESAAAAPPTTLGRRYNVAHGPQAVAAAAPKGLGLEYRAKKAGGDIKRKGMPDPYAYIPLSAKIVGNRHKSVRLTGNASVAGGNAKGAKAGSGRKTIGHKIKKHKK